MKNVERVRWLSRFDVEPLLSGTLRTGTIISIGLMIAALAAAGAEKVGAGYKIQAVGIPRLLQADLDRAGSPDFWYRFLADLGFSALLITPYVRLAIMWLYLAFVKKRRRYALYTSAILLLLAVVVFSDFALSAGISRALRWYPFNN